MVDLIDALIKRARKGIYGHNKNARLDPIRHSKIKKILYLDVHVPLKHKEANKARQVLGGALPKKVIIGFTKKRYKKKWNFADLTWES